jgi:hypothetical protein
VEIRVCGQCGAALEVIRDCPPHWGRLVCPGCGRGAGYARTPMEPEAVAG